MKSRGADHCHCCFNNSNHPSSPKSEYHVHSPQPEYSQRRRRSHDYCRRIRLYHSNLTVFIWVVISMMMMMVETHRPCLVAAWSTRTSTITSKMKHGKIRTLNYQNDRRAFIPPILHMSLDSRELRFYHRTTASSTTSPVSTTISNTASNAQEYRRSQTSSSSTGYDNTSPNNHHFHNSVIVPNYLSHLFPTSLLETQYKMMETITPVVVTAMSAVASAIRTTNVPSSGSTTTFESQKQRDQTSSLLVANRNSKDNATFKNTASSNRFNSTLTTSRTVVTQQQHLRRPRPPQSGYGPSIQLTTEELELFNLLRHFRNEIGLTTTLRVAGRR